MKSSSGSTTSYTANTKSKQPKLRINKLGIVSHDYTGPDDTKKDFSDTFDRILRILDKKGCDSVLFSLFTIDKQKVFNVKVHLESLTNITSVFVEEFINDPDKGPDKLEYFIHYKTQNCWEECRFEQIFAKSKQLSIDTEEKVTKSKDEKIKVSEFKNYFKCNRIFGNCAVLLCGETNIVKCSKKDPKDDVFNFLDTIPSEVTVILNPIHDRMTRFEMMKKRKFLSSNGRWVVSVWNKGKKYHYQKDNNWRRKDEKEPAWTVYHNETPIPIENISDQPNIEIGIVNINNNM
jgi:hypothetical protein